MNQDSVYAGPRLLAVADGMGGHAAGEVASAMALASIAPLDEDAPGADLLGALKDAADAANAHLRDMVSADEDLSGMGTTLVALLFSGTRLGLLHVGDSRCYLLRDDELTQITHDHTLVQSLIDEGRISEADASSHPQRSVITRVLDGRDDVTFDLSVREVRHGDRYLLCSDGLTGPVGSLETLREALLIAEPQGAVDRLVELALRGGGPDNVTVVIADVVNDDQTTTRPVVAGAAADSPQEPPAALAESPASRARVAEGRDVPPPRRPAAVAAPGRNKSRTRIALLVLLLLIFSGAATGYTYVRSQYFVGIDEGRVTVFRGVHGSVAGISLNTVQQRTTLESELLSEVERSRLERGIVAKDEDDATDIVNRLIISLRCAEPASPQRPKPAGCP